MISEQLKIKVEEISGSGIKKIVPVTGGCISSAFKINFNGDLDAFLKVDPECRNNMFYKEANGLKELKKAGAIRIPDVLGVSENFILLENIDSSPAKKEFFRDFALNFSTMHRFTGKTFGFYEDNFIGSTPQLNIPEEGQENNWTDFYFNKRILYQFKLAEKNGRSSEDLRKVIGKLENKIYSIFKGSEELPSLLHGDLWSGNYIADENGDACLIDPAVYYGHREADLAMTKLFGGFSNEFYEVYNENFPLPDGYGERENIYNLYHALNHLNIFGNGYYNKVLTLAKHYL